jgi:peptidoglycan/LPS O-acetylase OafA/YrhL
MVQYGNSEGRKLLPCDSANSREGESTEMKKQRNSGIGFLRIVAMLAIVAGHFVSQGGAIKHDIYNCGEGA